MAARSDLVLIYDRTYEIRDGVRAGADAGMRKLAFDIEAEAKQRVTAIDAIDTGALRASIYASTFRESGHAAALSSAKAASAQPGKKTGKPNETFAMFPDEPPMQNEVTVSVGAEYGIYIELGTVNMIARPYFAPAIEHVMTDAPVEIVRQINKHIPETRGK